MKTTENLPQKLFKKYMEQFDKYSDEKIIVVFNSEVGCMGWGTARASFLGALHKQFELRKFDYSIIGNERSLSFKSEIALIDKTVKKIPGHGTKPEALRGGLYKVEFSDDTKKGFKISRLY